MVSSKMHGKVPPQNVIMVRVQKINRQLTGTFGDSTPPVIRTVLERSRRETPAIGIRESTTLSRRLPPFALAAILLGCLVVTSLHPRVQVSPRLAESVWGAVGFLLLLICAVRVASQTRGRTLTYSFVPVKAHYVQLMMHASIYLYWGWYWRRVYHFWPLILIQLLFAYILDMCTCWLRRDNWILGLGAFPIVLSTNLFLWFKDDWFFLQFLMLALAVLCKSFVTWTRDNKRTHIFNPSGIALCVASIALIATNTTNITWGEVIANTLRLPPHIYLELFLLGLVVQLLFSVTCVTLGAAAVLYLLNLLFTGVTEMYYFVDSGISVSAFLGLHLLITDPATSPRTSMGKVLFGGLYGLGVFASYGALGWLGVPQFYDKLLCVPVLNLLVLVVDRSSEHLTRSLAGKIRMLWSQPRLNFAHMLVWGSLFVVMSATGFLSIPHPGEKADFWRQPCEKGSEWACRIWANLLRTDCSRGSGKSCLVLGRAFDDGYRLPHKSVTAGQALLRACNLGFSAGCSTAQQFLQRGGERELINGCDLGESAGCLVLASFYMRSNAAPKDQARAIQLLSQACNIGSSVACGHIAEAYLQGQGGPLDSAKAVEYLKKACQGDYAASCVTLASSQIHVLGVTSDPATRRRWLQRACSLGTQSVCRPGENPN
jgi:hypothetical protein